MESEENIYSKEFIDRLNNQNNPDEEPVKQVFSLNKWAIIAIAVFFVIVIVSIIIGILKNQKQEKNILIDNVSVEATQSHYIANRYQDRIDNVQVRALNKAFFQSLVALNNDLDKYTKKYYEKEQQAELSKLQKIGRKEIEDINKKLHKASLSETISRTYVQEMLQLNDRILDNLYKIVNSRHYNKATIFVSGEEDSKFIDRMKHHYDNLIKIKTDAKAINTVKR